MTDALLIAAGLFNLAFAVFHLFFWRLFRWPQQLAKLSAANRGIVQVLNLCLTYLFAFSALLCFLFPDELASTELGRFALLGLTGFWLVRAIYQPMFFGLEHPLSIALFFIFVLGTLIHGGAWWTAGGILRGG